MNTWLLAGVIALALACSLLAWRYVALRRGLARYVRALGSMPPLTLPMANRELEDLALAVRSIVSEFNQRLAGLHTEHDRLAAVLDQMTDGVLIADDAGLVLFANPAALRLFASRDAVGHTVTEVVRHHQLVDAWQRCRQARQLQSESLEIPARRQFLQLIVMPDRYSKGSLLFVQDLTRVRRLETVRRDFISNISHELRTPLASLKALTETLQGGALSDPEAGPWFLERVATEVDALTQMAQELLDLSRIESGQVQLDQADLQPKALLASAADRMRMQAERAALALRVECADDLPPVRADQSRVEQVLVNLIHNAVKFTRPGGSVVLSAAETNEAGEAAAASPAMVRFAIQDTGIGIPADDIGRIFERFYRVDKARSGGGTGLGLSIARHIVEAHGGRIWAESLEGQGSTFYFTLPVGQ
ncbi:MAG TPA: ATP-binding protein [Anaerolineales bacterium]|nr:ATP-binding protein [Anaerolineales bacterium]